MLIIKGLEKTSIIDYPPYVCCVIFLYGCNFRCGFCHNPELVVGSRVSVPDITAIEIFRFLRQRKKWLDAVCITGGEPTLHSDLPEFIRQIKLLGYKVKLDSNGTNPEMLESIFSQNIIDFIAMDIKTKIDDYSLVTNSCVDVEKIKKSVQLIQQSKIDYEFRTTVVPGIHTNDIFYEMGNWIKGSKTFVIQNFRPQVCLNNSYEKIKPFSTKDLEGFKDIMSEFVENVFIR